MYKPKDQQPLNMPSLVKGGTGGSWGRGGGVNLPRNVLEMELKFQDLPVKGDTSSIEEPGITCGGERERVRPLLVERYFDTDLDTDTQLVDTDLDTDPHSAT